MKQPAEVVGPLKILHDHHTGTSGVVKSNDVAEIVANGGEAIDETATHPDTNRFEEGSADIKSWFE